MPLMHEHVDHCIEKTEQRRPNERIHRFVQNRYDTDRVRVPHDETVKEIAVAVYSYSNIQKLLPDYLIMAAIS